MTVFNHVWGILDREGNVLFCRSGYPLTFSSMAQALTQMKEIQERHPESNFRPIRLQLVGVDDRELREREDRLWNW